MKLLRVYIAVAVLHLLIFSLVYIFIPGLRLTFIAEDQFLENLTATYYFNSFILGLILWLLSKYRKKAYLAMPFIGLICFLEEISFGERLIGFHRPVIGDKKIDGFHDFLELAIQKFNGMSGNLKGSVLLVILIAIILVMQNLQQRKNLPARVVDGLLNLTESYPPFLYFPFFVGSFIVSQIVDLELIHGVSVYLLLFAEEFFEMNAALTLLFASLAIRWQQAVSIPVKNLDFLKLTSSPPRQARGK